ncbi:hypothetical protein KCU73_g1709, partial [Aureobasidium melanogenum]
GHSQLKTGHPVRSAIHKQLNGRLVLWWVTTWESLLLYVLQFDIPFASSCDSWQALRREGSDPAPGCCAVAFCLPQLPSRMPLHLRPIILH